ncbi:MAG: hypothetical protein H8F28_01255, partial [Fibrella sp.]|nr:hypothetical protein [Armatimonadota bacterium]
MNDELNLSTDENVPNTGVLPSHADIPASEAACAVIGDYRIVKRNGTPVPFEYGGKQREIKFGRPEPFTSFDELIAYVDAVQATDVEGSPHRYSIHNGYYQARVLYGTLRQTPEGSVQYDIKQPFGLPDRRFDRTITVPLRRFHTRVWVAEEPWYQAPLGKWNWYLRDLPAPAPSAPHSFEEGNRFTAEAETEPLVPNRYGVDRNHADSARVVFERLLPDAGARAATVKLFAEVVTLAEQEVPGKWSVRLDSDGVYCVVGSYRILFLESRLLRFPLVTSAKSPELTEALERHEVDLSDSQYKSLPATERFHLPQQSLEELAPLVADTLPAFFALREVREYRLAADSINGHSPGVLKYLMRETGIDLPEPTFPEAGETAVVGAPRIWKIAPGERARLWDDARTNGYISIGWPELPDFGSYSDRDGLEAALVATYPGSRSGAVATIWRFTHEVKPGDIVVANQGV